MYLKIFCGVCVMTEERILLNQIKGVISFSISGLSLWVCFYSFHHEISRAINLGAITVFMVWNVFYVLHFVPLATLWRQLNDDQNARSAFWWRSNILLLENGYSFIPFWGIRLLRKSTVLKNSREMCRNIRKSSIIAEIDHTISKIEWDEAVVRLGRVSVYLNEQKFNEVFAGFVVVFYAFLLLKRECASQGDNFDQASQRFLLYEIDRMKRIQELIAEKQWYYATALFFDYFKVDFEDARSEEEGFLLEPSFHGYVDRP